MNEFSLAVILLDYVLGAAMWTLIGRFGMSLFVSEHSDFFFMRAFVAICVIRFFISLLRIKITKTKQPDAYENKKENDHSRGIIK